MNSRTATARSASATMGLLALVACGGDFDPGSRLTSLRVLAVIADEPFAKPGETVHLTLDAYDPTDLPDGSSTHKTTYAWAACVNPQSSTVVGCFLKFLEDARKRPGNPLQNGSVEVATTNVGFTYTIPTNALDGLQGEARSNALVGFVSIVCPGDLKFDATANILAGQLPVTCTDVDTGRVLDLTEFQLGIKRVFVRMTDRNANPVISSVTWDGAPWLESDMKTVDACPDDGNRFDRCDESLAHKVGASLTHESFEAGTDELGNAFTEQLIVEFYATEGIFKEDVRRADVGETEWVARKQSKGLDVSMWFVARDNRGGAALVKRRVHVR